jgi:hypothetical protein
LSALPARDTIAIVNISKRGAAVGAVALVGVIVAGWYAAMDLRRDAAALLERLPPGADAYLLIDLERLQSNPAVSRLLADPPEAAPAADYQRLLEETGFRYQDDLKQLAAAKLGGDWVGVARIAADRQRIVAYMESQGAVKSHHGSATVYAFGTERPFRIAFINDELAAFSAGSNPLLLNETLDRHSGGLAGTAGDDLRRGGELAVSPAGKGLWFVGRTDRLYADNPAGPRAGPFQFGREWFEGSQTITAWIASSPLNLEIELRSQYADAASAQRSGNAFRAVLAVLQAIPSQPVAEGGQDYSRLLAAVSITQEAELVTLRWRLDPTMLPSLVR